jgi:hypothetical protein
MSTRRRITRSLAIAATGAVVALAAAACGDDAESGASQDFSAADLKGLNLVPDDVPGMEYQPDVSGPGAFVADQEKDAEDEGDGSGLEFLADLARVGLEEDYVSQFFATSRDSELGFAESITFLFADEQAAVAAIPLVADAAARNVEPSKEIEPPDVGEQAFGIRGEFDGFPTYTFGWRSGDAIQLLTVAPGEPNAGAAAATVLAERLAAKAQA